MFNKISGDVPSLTDALHYLGSINDLLIVPKSIGQNRHAAALSLCVSPCLIVQSAPFKQLLTQTQGVCVSSIPSSSLTHLLPR